MPRRANNEQAAAKRVPFATGMNCNALKASLSARIIQGFKYDAKFQNENQYKR